MLSKEQLDQLVIDVQNGEVSSSFATISGLVEYAQKLQDDYAAQGLALKAAKAMQQAETERADNLHDIIAAVVCEEADALYFMGPDLYNKACDAVCATIQPLSTKE